MLCYSPRVSWLQRLFGSGPSLEQLVEKLRLIVLSSAPLIEIPAAVAATFDLWRRLTREQLSEELAEAEMQQLGAVNLGALRILWEPLSDVVGDPISPGGWNITSTMYLLRGQPWWLVRAEHPGRGEPSADAVATLETVVRLLGADAQRDLIMDMHFVEARWARYYTWFHTGSLYETHLNAATKDLRVVVEGTPVAPGYERMARIAADAL